MPYSQAPTPCHPALWRAPAVPMQCNTSMLPAPAPVCSKGVRSPAEPASAPRLLAADRRYGHLGPESAWIVANRPSSMPGRVWSSLVFAGRSAFPLNRVPAWLAKNPPWVGQSFGAERLGFSLTSRLATLLDWPSHHARPRAPVFFFHPESAGGSHFRIRQHGAKRKKEARQIRDRRVLIGRGLAR